jgi:predicted MFS family arabinose efflux permease
MSAQHRDHDALGALTTVVREKRFRVRTLPAGVAFWVAAATAFLVIAANTAVSPLYRLYQAQFGFSATTLTTLFTSYILVLVVTLLLFGSLSDYVGRRRVIAAGLAADAVGCVVFLIAHDVGPLFAGRALQGVAVGLVSGAASAALLDLRPAGGAAPLASSAALSGGQALGAIGASALAQYAPAPTHLVWWLLLGAFVIGIPAVLAMKEPGRARPGAVAALRPRVSVPREARGAFAVAAPALAGVWALGGFYLSLGPSLAAQLLHSENLLWGGVLIFLLTGLGAAASAAFRETYPPTVMLVGCLALVAGALVTFAAIETTTPAVLLVGTAVAGLGFGPAFMGAFRSVVALAPSHDRAGLITAVYMVSYLVTGIPAVIAGIATSHYGLHDTALVYSLIVAGLAVAGAGSLLVRRMSAAGGPERGTCYPDPPPAPCTAPRCLPPAPVLSRS